MKPRRTSDGAGDTAGVPGRRRPRQRQHVTWVERLAISLGGFVLGAITGPIVAGLLMAVAGRRYTGGDFFAAMDVMGLAAVIGALGGAVLPHVLGGSGDGDD